VRAFLLRAVHDAVEPRPEARFVGRERELAAIHAPWERARAERRCELVTIVGEAGVGKSRLVAEALSSFDARVVQGRCLPYGEGITYWPVVEILTQLRASPSDEAAAATIGSLLGERDVATSPEEIAWAVRKLLEEQASASAASYYMTRIDDESGAAISSEPGKRGPRTYFDVEDIKAGVGKVNELGGKASDPIPVPSMGWFATCEDDQGNEFGLWQSDTFAPDPRRPNTRAVLELEKGGADSAPPFFC
jgi:predicted enzyme related to lactoylglutathione lyase